MPQPVNAPEAVVGEAASKIPLEWFTEDRLRTAIAATLTTLVLVCVWGL